MLLVLLGAGALVVYAVSCRGMPDQISEANAIDGKGLSNSLYVCRFRDFYKSTTH